MDSSKVTLYFAPSSYSSQIARLALVEKHVQFTPALIDIHNRCENLTREYALLNPNLVVPTLKHGEAIITDCHNIMKYVDRNFVGPELGAADEVLMDKAISIQTSVNEFLLTFSFLGEEKASALIKKKLEVLQGLIDEEGELMEVFEKKMQAIEKFAEEIFQPGVKQKMVGETNAALDALEAQLAASGGPYALGTKYTMADIVLTVLLGRIELINSSNTFEFSTRPLVV